MKTRHHEMEFNETVSMAKVYRKNEGIMRIYPVNISVGYIARGPPGMVAAFANAHFMARRIKLDFV